MAIDGMTVLAVIPARSGSKRCPGKNFKLFRGKVLYQWSVDAAAQSKYIDMVKVSFDADRPPELSNDQAMNEDVLRHHLVEHPHNWVVLLQPTSPLRTAEDIDACIERAQMGDGCISFNDETFQKNGAVYVAKAEWIAMHEFSHVGLMKYMMPAERSLDIDYPQDFDK